MKSAKCLGNKFSKTLADSGSERGSTLAQNLPVINLIISLDIRVVQFSGILDHD